MSALRAIPVFALAALAAPVAHACDCARPARPTAEQRAQISKDLLASAVTVRVTRFSIRNSDEPVGEASSELVAQPPDGTRYPRRFTIYGHDGDEGANCGDASALFQAASTGDVLTVNVYRERDGRHFVPGCGLREVRPRWSGGDADAD